MQPCWGPFYNGAVTVDAIVDTGEILWRDNKLIIRTTARPKVSCRRCPNRDRHCRRRPTTRRIKITMYNFTFPRPYQQPINTPRAIEMYEIERNIREADASFRAARKARRSSLRRAGLKRH